MADINKEKIVDILFAFICRTFPLADPKSLKLEDNLIETGIVDSLGVFVIIEFIEETFSMSVQNEDVVPDNFASIEAMASYIKLSLG